MKRVAEIIYVVESEREEFLQGALQPDEETKRVLWLCGVRKQQYFSLNELIFMTFEYGGENFEEDMKKMAAYLDSKGCLIKKRRKEVPAAELSNTNWWAPVKRLGTLFTEKPAFHDEQDEHLQESFISALDGGMDYQNENYDIAFDEEEWMENIQIWKN